MTYHSVRRLLRFVPLLSLLWASPSSAQEAPWGENAWEDPWERGSFSTPSCSLDLRFGRRTRGEREDFWGLVVAVMPLSGCSGVKLGGSGEREPSSEPGEGTWGALADAPSRGEAATPSPVRAIRASWSPEPAPAEVRSFEPEVRDPWEEERPRSAPRLTPALLREVVRRALRAGGFDVEEQRLEDMRSRARLSGLFPELRLRGALGVDQTTSLAGAGLYPGDLTTRDGLDSAAEVRLTFRLNRLIYDDVEPGLARLRLQIAGARQKLVDRTLDWLFLWERHDRTSREPELDVEARLDAELRASEAALRLHELTGGWFLSALEQLEVSASAGARGGPAPARPRPSVELSGRRSYARRAPWSPTSSSSASKIPPTPARRARASSP